MRRPLAFLALGSILLARSAHADHRADVARHHAPVIFQEAHDPIKDLLTAYDFDGNWNGDDNADDMACWSDASQCKTPACQNQGCPLVATVYYTVIETDTHWFVQYMPYHPLDWKLTNGHEHDTESMLAVVSKDGTEFGALQLLEVRFHTDWLDYGAPGVAVGPAADEVDGPIHFHAGSGRPAVYSQMVGHGLCGGFSPPNYFFPDLQLSCKHDEEPHIDQTGIVYSPDFPPAMPLWVSNQAVQAGYAMVELYTSMWQHIYEIGPGKAFKNAIDYEGERCSMFECPKQFGGAFQGNQGQSPGMPWAQEGGAGVDATGDQFFDPAYTMSKRLSFPQPFSLTYCHNPYLGITGQCPDDADAGAGGGGAGGAGGAGTGGQGGTTAGTGGSGSGAGGAMSSSSSSGDGGSVSTASSCSCRAVGAEPRWGAWAALAAVGLFGARRRARRRS